MALYDKQLADTRDALDWMSDVIHVIRKTADINVGEENLPGYLHEHERYLVMTENTLSKFHFPFRFFPFCL